MKKITVIGGGTGTYTLLTGLKNYDTSLSAIVTASDSGGSSGKLRDEFGILPPGDLRRCLVALSENRGDIWRKLFEYRFSGDNEKNNLGNLIITALTEITGSFPSATEAAAELLEVKGTVVPVTLDDVHLCAKLENGQIILGESNIDIPKHDGSIKIEKVYLQPRAFAYKKAIYEIMNSDIVVIGPGDLYTSVIPNLLVEGISQALKDTKAKVVYVCNVMTKHGETNNFSASDFLKEVQRYSDNSIDIVVLNTEKPSPDMALKYASEQSYFVEPNIDGDPSRVLKTDLINHSILFRHDSHKLSKLIMEI